MSTFGNIFDRILDQRVDTPEPVEEQTVAQLSARFAEPEEQVEVEPSVKTGWTWLLGHIGPTYSERNIFDTFDPTNSSIPGNSFYHEN